MLISVLLTAVICEFGKALNFCLVFTMCFRKPAMTTSMHTWSPFPTIFFPFVIRLKYLSRCNIIVTFFCTCSLLFVSMLHR